MAKRIVVRAAFGYTDDEAIDRFRQGIPDSNADITSDGQTVNVTARYTDEIFGPGIVPEGAEVALRQVRQLAEIAGLGPEQHGSYEIQDF
jgi:hypothetical protein